MADPTYVTQYAGMKQKPMAKKPAMAKKKPFSIKTAKAPKNKKSPYSGSALESY